MEDWRPLTQLRTVLDELVDVGVLDRKRRGGIEYPIRSAVHGLAVLTAQWPLRDVPDATRHHLERLTSASIEGRSHEPHPVKPSPRVRRSSEHDPSGGLGNKSASLHLAAVRGSALVSCEDGRSMPAGTSRNPVAGTSDGGLQKPNSAPNKRVVGRRRLSQGVAAPDAETRGDQEMCDGA